MFFIQYVIPIAENTIHVFSIFGLTQPKMHHTQQNGKKNKSLVLFSILYSYSRKYNILNVGFTQPKIEHITLKRIEWGFRYRCKTTSTGNVNLVWMISFFYFGYQFELSEEILLFCSVKINSVLVCLVLIRRKWLSASPLYLSWLWFF